jgi:hypothetical protein
MQSWKYVAHLIKYSKTILMACMCYTFLIEVNILLCNSFVFSCCISLFVSISYRRPGGDKIYNVFDNQLPAALKRLQFDKQLSMENIRKLITEADGYQPHLIAPEQGYRRLIESTLVTIRGPAEAAVDAVCFSQENYQ